MISLKKLEDMRIIYAARRGTDSGYGGCNNAPYREWRKWAMWRRTWLDLIDTHIEGALHEQREHKYNRSSR